MHIINEFDVQQVTKKAIDIDIYIFYNKYIKVFVNGNRGRAP